MNAQNARTAVLQPYAGIEADSAVEAHSGAQAAHSEELDVLNAALEAYRAQPQAPVAPTTEEEPHDHRLPGWHTPLIQHESTNTEE